ncbi:putative phosphatase regulatory subunit-domain-containing protein [Hyaloraphidium curvatum]|nr:putative phosphatase regulatory subunit-domain-containing protein [Hyaloraphidium curvatum]
MAAVEARTPPAGEGRPPEPRKRPPSPTPFRAQSPAGFAGFEPPKDKPDRKKTKRAKPHSRANKQPGARGRRRSVDDDAPPLLVRTAPAPPPAPQGRLGKSLFQDFERTLQDIGKLLKRTVPANLRTEDGEDGGDNENADRDQRGSDSEAPSRPQTPEDPAQESSDPLAESFQRLDLASHDEEPRAPEVVEIRALDGDAAADVGGTDGEDVLAGPAAAPAPEDAAALDAVEAADLVEFESSRRRVRFHSEELSIVLAFHAAAPPVALYDSGAACLAFPDPGDRYFELEREREREREEEERKFVHGVVVHGWTPYPAYAGDEPSTLRVEDVRLRARTTVGVTIAVRNLAFNKRVVVRFTLDRWHSFQEVEAKFVTKLNPNDDSWDRFLAEIEVPSDIFRRDPTVSAELEEHEDGEEDPVRGTAGGRMFFAIKFLCPGAGEWWDNNRGRNFEVEFRRRRRQNAAWEGEAVFRNMRRKDIRRTERTRRKQEEWDKHFPNVADSRIKRS